MGRLLLLSMFLGCLSMQAQDCPTVLETTQDFCEGFDYDTYEIVYPTVGSLRAPEGVTWYAVKEGGNVLDSGTEISTNGSYFAAFDGCSARQEVAVKLGKQPVSGRLTYIHLCSNSGPVDIQELIEPYKGRVSQPGGYFTNTEVFEDGSYYFDPALDPAGQYTYVKPSEDGICEPDETRIYIRIVPAPNPGESAEVELPFGDYTVDLASFLGGNPDSEGAWSPSLASGTGIFNPSRDTAGTYTYTVENSEYFSTEQEWGHCTESAIVVVSVQTKGNVSVCHNGRSMKVNVDAFAAHLNHGDSFGACKTETGSKTVVSPNPSRGVFNFRNKGAEISVIRILDFKGNLQREFSAESGAGLNEIDITDLKKGIYFAEIFTSHGKQVERLIKK